MTAPRLTYLFALLFGIFGALAPLGIVLYEHRISFLPIRTIELLWPSSLLFLPDPARRFPILLNSLSIAINAAIYAFAGFLIGACLDFLRSRRAMPAA